MRFQCIWACLEYARYSDVQLKWSPATADFPRYMNTEYWQKLNVSDDSFVWQAGDIALVIGHHAELVVDVLPDGTVKTFGWGAVRTEYPHRTHSSLAGFRNSWSGDEGSKEDWNGNGVFGEEDVRIPYTVCWRLKSK